MSVLQPGPDRYGEMFKAIGSGRHQVTFDPKVRDERDPEFVTGVFVTRPRAAAATVQGLVPIPPGGHRRLYDREYPEGVMLFETDASNDGHRIVYEVGFSDEIRKL